MQGRCFFLSDLHLGHCGENAQKTERDFIHFLKNLPADTTAIYLLGDIFDFWLEYRKVVVKGHTRTLAALADCVEKGIEIYFIKGNHDWWTYGYLARETGVKVVERQPVEVEMGGKWFCLAHGDDLGPRKPGFRIITFLFKSKVCVTLLKMLPTSWIVSFAHKWSSSNRKKHLGKDYCYTPDSPLLHFARNYRSPEGHNIDYFIFGHFHTPTDLALPGGARMMVIGDWDKGPRYIEFDGELTKHS
ncbi:MAG: UDP-2,3-diacylglucosamine diphosphatase [Bacteroidales bacterium]|nr:UDP-2,3-diacylglucosamine diphosphatase [Bacteroidales bacterium]